VSEDLAAAAREIIDSNLYMALGTADGEGRPWVSPVYFAREDYSSFLWISAPEATHSRNLVARPEVAIVIFDSQVPIGTGRGVYMAASAEQVADAELDRGLAVFSERSVRHGGKPFTRDQVLAPAKHRLYRAVASEQFILDPHDRRIPVPLDK
jgi:nitroimidazol reductase NimA-like FMN-containing flavoprotein (pyridoxamine 5'-phosphate oxidase superfamily)